MNKLYLIYLVSFIVLSSCNSKEEPLKDKLLFSKITSNETHISFSNNLTETEDLNYFNYTSIYMGCGVATGDINNDGLLDLYFVGNQVSNRLYLNKGNLEFEDISEQANVIGDSRWYTGVTMVDINNDGYLDIYCSVAGKDGVKNNQLFINNKDNTFVEKAKSYGLDDAADSVQATFFDFDNDGDLDVYIANYPIAHPSTPNMVYKDRMDNVTDAQSDKLFRNDNGQFVNISEQAGVKNYSFSLGITAADLNNDGWQDLYVSNDYSIPDFLYLNNQDGTFKEVIKKSTSQTAFYGMGIDVADFNNDGFLDVFQVDMDSNNNRRQKANMASMNPEVFQETLLYGFHYQYMHNCLQLNSGYNENGIPKFSNVSRLSGTSSTDWSWGPLFADFDNDGYKDLFITNGTRREVNNKDFFNKIGDSQYSKYSLLEKTKMIPSEKIDNFMFKNLAGLQFEKTNKNWGIEHKGFSNGATYADLDNDGDLEIITNNLDEKVSIFKNNGNSNRYLNVKLVDVNSKNKSGLGARVFVYTKNKTQMQELTLTRGYRSSVAPELHYGLGSATAIDSVVVKWSADETQVLKNVKANQNLVVTKDIQAITNKAIAINKIEKIFLSNTTIEGPKHKENPLDDFETQVLLPHKMSTLGPALAVADVNGDGLDDYYFGGAFAHTGNLYIQQGEAFVKKTNEDFSKDKNSEDISALFTDVDQDGDQDLYVVSGGYEFFKTSSLLQDRLYINDGDGNFKRSINALPNFKSSGSKAYEIDFNKDGKQDLLVLGRQIPGKYPHPASTYLLKNISSNQVVKFEDATKSKASSFIDLGMATSAMVTDFNKDGWQDIIVVGEWMSIKVFKNTTGTFTDVSDKMGLTNDTAGWWWSINQGDFDNDGDTDYILGNNGLNYKYKATPNETFDIYVNDFDKNNKSDIVLSYYNEGKQYPVRGRECSSQQIPAIKQKFKNYNDFSQATLVDVYGEQKLKDAIHYQIKSFASVYMENKGTHFELKHLPEAAQLSSINQILIDDYDKDGFVDAIVAGNLYNSEVETPRNDAGYGLFLKGDGTGGFTETTINESGLYIPGDVKDLKHIKINNKDYIMAAKNNDFIQFIKTN